MILNSSQTRSVTITLRLLEERLAEVERLLTVDERGILYTRVAHFLPRQCEQMRALINELRATIKTVAENFHLPREDYDPARRMIGLLNITWESLEEMDAAGLKAYGQTDARLPELLEPHQKRLVELVLRLESVANQANEVDGKEPVAGI